MREIVLGIEESHYAVFLQFLQTLDYVQVKPLPNKPNGSKRFKQTYDFSDLSGKLEWQGDSITEQRKLRDEW